MKMNSIIKNRNIGLDIFRTISISFVLIAHLSLLFSNFFDVNLLLHGVGYIGVEFFFVLSGFLIGRILIKALEEKNNFFAMRSFLVRRWLRTIPLYYLILMFVVIYHNGWNFLPHHLFFVQNFFPAARDSLFGVSWSLVIEEWFYLISALVLFSSAQFVKYNLKNILLVFCLVVITMSLLGRVAYVTLLDTSYSDIRKMVFVRLDAPAIGLLLAVIEKYYSFFYNTISRYRYFFVSISVFSLMLCLSIFTKPVQEINSVFERTSFFTITPIFAVFILVALEKGDFRWLGKSGARLFIFLSLSSYAVYLIHWDVMQYLRYNFSFPSCHSFIEAVLLFLLIIFTTYSISVVLMNFWEKPFLNLRDSALFSKRVLGKES